MSKKKSKHDPSKPCSWCNTCRSSFCDCGPCTDQNCRVCYELEYTTGDCGDPMCEGTCITGSEAVVNKNPAKQKKFRWNDVPEKSSKFWDHSLNDGLGDQVEKLPESDLSLVKSHNQCRFEDILRAVCHVVAELVEIEEARAREIKKA